MSNKTTNLGFKVLRIENPNQNKLQEIIDYIESVGVTVFHTLVRGSCVGWVNIEQSYVGLSHDFDSGACLKTVISDSLMVHKYVVNVVVHFDNREDNFEVRIEADVNDDGVWFDPVYVKNFKAVSVKRQDFERIVARNSEENEDDAT